MAHTYVKIPEIYKKMKAAEAEKRVLFISAPVGSGKSAAIEYYLRRQDHLFLTGIDGRLNEMPEGNEINQPFIVIDDVSWIVDPDSENYILDLIDICDRKGKTMILAGRSRLPSWLQPACIEYGFILADERDLLFGEKQIKKIFQIHGIDLNESDVFEIMNETKGYPVSVTMLTYHMQDGKDYSVDIYKAAQLDMYRYFFRTFYAQWDNELKEVLLAVSVFPSFTVQLAEMVTGNVNIRRVIERAFSVGSFLFCGADDSYVMRPLLRGFLEWRCGIEYSKEWMNEIYGRAALYYEIRNDIENALYYYELADDRERIFQFLIKNAEKHTGTGHFFETRRYYLSLPKEMIVKSPLLMCGMSMLHSLLMQTEESEYWYDQLVQYEKRQEVGKRSRKEATMRRAYLDIALPHRGITNIIKTLKNTAIMVTNKEIQMPEFSVTSNLPSIMNGGLDFCEWSKNDRNLAILMKKPVELLLGKHSPGLVNIALAESFFEKSFEGQNDPDDYKIMTLLNSGYTMADMKGKIEMCFVAIGVMVKLHISHNQPQVAKTLLMEFREKAIAENALRLLPNIDAMRVWLKLLAGNMDIDKELSVENWLADDAPNENREFYILERYRYMVKIRVYIVMGQYEDAARLIERVLVYFEKYNRTFFWIQAHLLKAILQYRLGKNEWQVNLQKAVSKAQEYKFTQIIAAEGAAVKPLLLQAQSLEWDDAYCAKVLNEVDREAQFYPDYLKERCLVEEPLTKMENTILHLLCKGNKSTDICDLYHISYNTLKYHNKNIYRKLGVKNRAEAVQMAGELGIYRA
ncbi:LuxR C-terminal-related transcriptional regulator [Hespellia stercorisuis]|uniref:LuxR family transcriptional regulator, maltose regulon positive regulatory protein n=1 Tax=Hespellia stercorisuis DSM 15480 TaxID=1121950 RepID=A0A1M6VFD6_9FIRM|nr:LuxR C-terminal-related transcriptional regulator [Hespellia stercorisuis]SHK80243.1 LuxR family transcriptional regulator, maltose regulon positive regulatory protein [Hespellia stercorisuis DSM 15480]